MALSKIGRRVFLQELKSLKQMVKPAWVILGDFNLIYKTSDKNNGRLNRRMMDRFRRTLNFLEVQEAQLVGRKYIWSNEQRDLTMTRIDRAFFTTAWEEIYSSPTLQPLSSLASDHCPLIMEPMVQTARYTKFRFE